MERKKWLMEVLLGTIEGHDHCMIHRSAIERIMTRGELTRESVRYHLWLCVDAGFLVDDGAGNYTLTNAGHDHIEESRYG